MKLISSFLTNRKFRVTVEGELSTPREIQAGVPQGSVLVPNHYNVYINDTDKPPGIHLTISANDVCVCICNRPQREICF